MYLCQWYLGGIQKGVQKPAIFRRSLNTFLYTFSIPLQKSLFAAPCAPELQKSLHGWQSLNFGWLHCHMYRLWLRQYFGLIAFNPTIYEVGTPNVVRRSFKPPPHGDENSYQQILRFTSWTISSYFPGSRTSWSSYFGPGEKLYDHSKVVAANWIHCIVDL
jgi:hypothetical protein